MAKYILIVLVFTALLSVTMAFPFIHSNSTPDASSLRRRCLIGRFACFGPMIKPAYVPVAVSHPKNIVLNNNNEIDITPPNVVAPAYTRIEEETVALTVTEMAPVTIIASFTDMIVDTQRLPAETVVMNNFATVSEVETAFVTENVLETETPPAETVIMNNFATVTDVETASVTENVFETETPPAETVVMNNYATLTEVDTASFTEIVMATEIPPAETVVVSNYETFTDVETASVTESFTVFQTPPAETVVMNNFITVTQEETKSIIQFAAPSPMPYPVVVEAHEAAPCQELSCTETPVCVSETEGCT